MVTTRNERLALFPSRGESNDPSKRSSKSGQTVLFKLQLKLLAICKGKDNNATGRFEC